MVRRLAGVENPRFNPPLSAWIRRGPLPRDNLVLESHLPLSPSIIRGSGLGGIHPGLRTFTGADPMERAILAHTQKHGVEGFQGSRTFGNWSSILISTRLASTCPMFGGKRDNPKSWVIVAKGALGREFLNIVNFSPEEKANAERENAKLASHGIRGSWRWPAG